MFRQHVEQHDDLGDAAAAQKISKIMRNRKNLPCGFYSPVSNKNSILIDRAKKW